MPEIISPCFLGQVKPSDIDKELDPETVGALWRYAKANYIDKGVGYGDMMDGMSEKLGVPRSLLSKALAKPKAMRPLLMEAYKRNRARQQALQQARLEAKYINAPALPRYVQMVNDAYRGLKTIYHGPVFPFTHAMDVAKMPTKVGDFAHTVVNSWKYMSTAQHLQAMEVLRDDPAFGWGLRSGLVIDPERGPIGILAKKGGTWASRAWDSLKVLRLELFKNDLFDEFGNWKAKYADLSDSEKLEVAKATASRWNHLTGATSPGEGNLGMLSNIMFAPELTAAKWHAFVTDGAKAGALIAKMPMGLSRAEKQFLGTYMRTTGEMMAGRVLMMATNAGLMQAGVLTLPGQEKQQINWSNPAKADWLRPKAFGQTFNMRGQDELVQLFGKLYMAYGGSQSQRRILAGRFKNDKRYVTGDEAFAKTALNYATSKLAPFPAAVKEAVSGENYFGRPLPWTGRPGDQRHPHLTGLEFTGETLGPIWMEGAIKEFYQGMRDAGIDPHTANGIMRGLTNPKVVGHALLTGSEEFQGLGVYDEKR